MRQMFTKPTIVSSTDLTKRAYISFYFNNRRIREYNGNSLNLKIFPNHAPSLDARNKLLDKLQFELHKALDSGNYPASIEIIEKSVNQIKKSSKVKASQNTIQLLFQAIKTKLRSDLSKTYKRDLKAIYRQFRDDMEPDELKGDILSISTASVEKFLSQFGSSGTYYMNKRRNLGVLFSAAGRQIDKPIKSVKSTQRRRTKAKLHQKYDKEQLKPILNYLKANHFNLYICCLLTYGSWLRPHEEIRLLIKDNFKNESTEVHLSGGENKGGKVRVVYIPDYIREEINPILAVIQRQQNIFSRSSVPFNESYFNTQWSRAWKKMNELGLIYENQTIYSFRHTAAVDLYKRTKDVYLLQKLLGHSTIVVTLKYLRTLGELNTEDLISSAPQL